MATRNVDGEAARLSALGEHRAIRLALRFGSHRGRGCLSPGVRGAHCSDAFGEPFRRCAGGEVEDPGGEFGVGSLDAVAVQLEEGEIRNAFQAPNANAFAERWVRTARSD